MLLQSNSFKRQLIKPGPETESEKLQIGEFDWNIYKALGIVFIEFISDLKLDAKGKSNVFRLKGHKAHKCSLGGFKVFHKLERN